MSDKAPVYSLASNCNDIFQACSGPARNAGPFMENLLEEHERRFVAWWQSLNDSASNEMNLDRKLQNHSTIRDILLRLLMILQMNLEKLQQFLSNQAGDSHLDAYDPNTGERNPVKTNVASTIPETVEDTLKAIDDALKELGHFSAAMRESRKSSETKWALAFAATHYDSTHFERMAFLVVETLYPDAPEALQSQLSRSMADRNLRLNYRAFRYGKFRRFNRSSGLSGHHHDDSLRRNAESAIATQINGPGGTFPDNAAHTPGQQHKGTLPTSLNTSQFRQHLATPIPSKSRLGATTAVLSSSVPPLPDFTGKNDVQCQWCFFTIPKTYVQNGKWSSDGRKHYLADLEPYVCISEECSDSLPTFSSARLWKAHMESHNTMLRSNLSRQPDATSDVDAVANPSRPTDGCPICGYTIDRLDLRAVTRDPPIKGNRTSGASKRSGEERTKTSTKRIKISGATGSKGKTQSLDDQDYQAVAAAMETHILGHLEFLMVLSLKLGDNEDADSGSGHDDDKSKTVEVSHGLSNAEHLGERSIEDMPSLPSGTPPRPSSVTISEYNESPETDSIWSDVFEKTHSSVPLSPDEDKILMSMQKQKQMSENLQKQSVPSSTNEDKISKKTQKKSVPSSTNKDKISKKPQKQNVPSSTSEDGVSESQQRQAWSTGGGGYGGGGYSWDYISSYRMDRKGLVRYLYEIFTSDSHRKRIRCETFDEDHYRVWIPRQLTVEEKSDSFLEKHRWAKRDDNPFA